MRTKQYIAAFPNISVREHSPKHIEGYVISKANDNQLKEWQFTQIVAVARQKQALEEVRRVLEQLGEKHVMNTPGMAVKSPVGLI